MSKKNLSKFFFLSGSGLTAEELAREMRDLSCKYCTRVFHKR